MSIVLDATTLKLTVALSGAVTTSELPIVASYADRTATEITPGSVDTQTSGATAVDAVPAPAASTQRLVKSLSIHNADSVDATVTVALDNAGTARTLVVITLGPGESLEYADGWKALDAAGNQKLVIQNTSLHALGGALHSAATLAELNALVSDATLDDSGDPRTDSAAVHAADFDANTILKADADDTPTALAVGEGRVVGRLAGGVITDLTATESRTLLNVEDGADATDAANVAAAGAVMDSDVSEAEGILRKTGAGTYEAVKTNLGAATDPGVGDDSDDGYAVGSRWINTTDDKEYVCLDASVGAAVWTETTGAAAGGASALDDLSDVAISGAAQGDILRRDGTGFENENIAEQRIVLRLTGEDVKGGTAAEARALLGLDSGEIFLTAAGGWPSTTGGCAPNALVEYGTNDVDLYSLDFDAAADEYAQWSVWMPDDWDGGTVTAKFVWTAASSTGDVIWGLQGRSYADDDAIDQAWGTAQTVTDTLLATGDVHYSGATSAITLAGTPAAGQLVQIRAYRDADNGSDTLAADARLLGIKIYYGRS